MEITSAETMAPAPSSQPEQAGVQQWVGQATRRVGDAGARFASAARERARRHPFAAAGIAVGALLGMALGAGLFRRRRRPH